MVQCRSLAQFPMLRDIAQPDADSIGVIFCFVVAPECRRQGVARALLDAACEGFRSAGFKAVQARPARHAEGAAANHLGPLSMYLAAGFSIVAETPGGDVFVRKELRGPAVD
jgi:ribosomal protein S18 acetylase RimI-like enzyme